MTDLMKIALSSADYPVWKDTISLPAGSTFQYKYLKKTASGDVSPSEHDFLNIIQSYPVFSRLYGSQIPTGTIQFHRPDLRP